MSGHSVFLMFSRSSIYTETSQQRQLHKLYLVKASTKIFHAIQRPFFETAQCDNWSFQTLLNLHFHEKQGLQEKNKVCENLAIKLEYK